MIDLEWADERMESYKVDELQLILTEGKYFRTHDGSRHFTGLSQAHRTLITNVTGEILRKRFHTDIAEGRLEEARSEYQWQARDSSELLVYIKLPLYVVHGTDFENDPYPPLLVQRWCDSRFTASANPTGVRNQLIRTVIDHHNSPTLYYKTLYTINLQHLRLLQSGHFLRRRRIKRDQGKSCVALVAATV